MKKRKIVLMALFLLVAVALAGFVYKYEQKKNDAQFLSKLKGEVVFTRRNKDGVADIWKINANGSGEKMLFHNDFGIPYAGASFPQWSEDGERIYFLALDNSGDGKIFEINLSTWDIFVNLELTKDKVSEKWSDRKSRVEDIIHRDGDLYIVENGREIKIYDHWGFYNQDYWPGAGEASWSPDKEYVIFNGSRGIMIADKYGHTAKLTDGADADWKY